MRNTFYEVDVSYVDTYDLYNETTVVVLTDDPHKISDIVRENMRYAGDILLTRMHKIDSPQDIDEELDILIHHEDEIAKQRLVREYRDAKTSSVILIIGLFILGLITAVLINDLGDAQQEIDKQNDTIYSQKVVIDSFKRAYPKEFKNILPK